MSAIRILEKPKDYAYYHADYMAKHEATNNAWIAEMQAAQALYESDTWKETGCKTWREFCEGNMPYADSTYREARMNIPIAELAAAVANTTLSREDANRLGKKLNEVIPEAERTSMKFSVLALCYAAFPDTPVPARNVIDEAYAVLKEERDNGTITTKDGETFNLKEKAQVSRLKERVLQDIQSRSTRVTISIEISREIGIIRRALRRMGHDTPNEDKKLLISWKD